MCTTIVSIDPESAVPVLLIGVRDEFLDRAWQPPDRHWSHRPTLIGGVDLLAGGTWLAVNSALPRVACVLNGRGVMAEESVRLSRGDLPLRLAGDGVLGPLDAVRYDPFHLFYATPSSAHIWSWDGAKLTERSMGPGLHLIVNSGLADGGDDDAGDDTGPGAEEMKARVACFRPLLEQARRPEPQAGPTPTVWGEWLPLADGAGLDPQDPRALVVRRNHLDRPWGTSSVSLVALGRSGIRYDFCDKPGDPEAWSTILTPAP